MGTKNLPPHEAAKLGGSYETFADKVGLVPNLRLKDNVLQAAVCGAFAVLGGLAGLALGEARSAFLLGGFLGLVCGVLLSGGVLLIVGRFHR